jgi:uncharacterized membrane protein
MMLAEPAAHSGARQHWWKVLLAVSLALNLFFVIGAMWIRIHAPPPMLTPEGRLEQMSSALGLDPQQQRAFTHYSQTMRGLFQSMRKTVQPLIASAWSEMGKPQADEATIMQLFDRAAQQRRILVHDITTTTLSFLATLSPEQRAEFVKLAHQTPHPWSSPPDRNGAR